MKVEMDEQIKAVERAGEEERLRLQHELSRVRQEAVSMAKKNSEQRADLQKLHAEQLASKEQELSQKLESRERELQEQMRMALEKSRSEYLKLTQEKEQQESLALEELELQKKPYLQRVKINCRDLGKKQRCTEPEFVSWKRLWKKLTRKQNSVGALGCSSGS